MAEQDKNFARYAFLLIGGIAVVLTYLVSSGIAGMPDSGFLVKEAALGLGFRAAYKSLDGSNWIRDALEYTGMITAEAAEAAAPAGMAEAA